jgi:hypothetical protein
VSPVTHLLASWIVAQKTTDNHRDCVLVTCAGLIPDLDGLGLIVDLITRFSADRPTHFYGQYHHFLGHGVFAAVGIALGFAALARRKWLVAGLSLVTFHLHLFCDLIGSRGPEPDDLWPIYYLGPLRKDPMWLWKGQWPLDGPANRIVFIILFGLAIWLALRHRKSVVGVFSLRADQVFIGVLEKWRDSLAKWVRCSKSPLQR